MADQLFLFGGIEGIMFLGAGFSRHLPQFGGAGVGLGAGLDVNGMDLALKIGGTAQPDGAVGFLVKLEKPGKLLPAAAVEGRQNLLVGDLRKLDFEIDVQPVILDLAGSGLRQLAILGGDGRCGGIGLGAIDARTLVEHGAIDVLGRLAANRVVHILGRKGWLGGGAGCQSRSHDGDQQQLNEFHAVPLLALKYWPLPPSNQGRKLTPCPCAASAS